MKTIVITIIFFICSSFFFIPKDDINYVALAQLMYNKAKVYGQNQDCSDYWKAISILKVRAIICDSLIKINQISSEQDIINDLLKSYQSAGCGSSASTVSIPNLNPCPVCAANQIVRISHGGTTINDVTPDQLFYSVLTPEQKKKISELIHDSSSQKTLENYEILSKNVPNQIILKNLMNDGNTGNKIGGSVPATNTIGADDLRTLPQHQPSNDGIEPVLPGVPAQIPKAKVDSIRKIINRPTF